MLLPTNNVQEQNWRGSGLGEHPKNYFIMRHCASATDQLLKTSACGWLLQVGYCEVYCDTCRMFFLYIWSKCSWNIRSQEQNFHRAKVVEHLFQRNESSTGQKFQGANVLQNKSFTKVVGNLSLWTFCSREWKCSGMKSPSFILALGSYNLSPLAVCSHYAVPAVPLPINII